MCTAGVDRLNRPSSGFSARMDMLEYEAALTHAGTLDAAFEVGQWAQFRLAMHRISDHSVYRAQACYSGMGPCPLLSSAVQEGDMAAAEAALEPAWACIRGSRHKHPAVGSQLAQPFLRCSILLLGSGKHDLPC